MPSPQTAQRRTLAVACIVTAMLMLDIAVINTAIPNIAKDPHAGLSGVQWVIDAYTLTLAATVLTAGSLADRFGRKRSFIAGLTLFTASSLTCGAGRQSPGPGRRPGRAGHRCRDHVRHRAGPHRRLVRDRPTDRRRADQLAELAVDLLRQPAHRHRLQVAAIKVPEARDPFARKPDLVGQTLLGAGLFLLTWPCCAATRTAGPAPASSPN